MSIIICSWAGDWTDQWGMMSLRGQRSETLRRLQETPGDQHCPATNLLDTNLGTTLGLLTNDGNPAFSTFFLSLLLHTTFVLNLNYLGP